MRVGWMRVWCMDLSSTRIRGGITNMTPELLKILENVKEYCEDEAIYDKLSSYGDFYYKIVELLKKEKV
jgi:hypothetical protein